MLSYTKASEALFVTQPSISYGIAMLEKELGVSLFGKAGHHLWLTQNGKIFYKQVNLALHELEMGISLVKNQNALYTDRQPLRIYTERMQYAQTLINGFREFSEENASFSIRLSQGDSADIVTSLKNNDSDIGFCRREIRDPQIRTEVVRDLDFVLMVPHDHPLCEKESIDLRQIQGYPVVIRRRNTPEGEQAFSFFAQAGIEPQIVGEANSFYNLALLVSNHYGIGIAPLLNDMDKLNIKIIPISFPNCRCWSYMIYSKKRPLPLAGHLFRRFILEHYGDV